MKHFLIGTVVALALIAPAGAQAPPSPSRGIFERLSELCARRADPGDAYRQGLISRWELEQLQGPTPQAMQGPSPDGGNAGGGGSRGGN